MRLSNGQGLDRNKGGATCISGAQVFHWREVKQADQAGDHRDQDHQSPQTRLDTGWT